MTTPSRSKFRAFCLWICISLRRHLTWCLKQFYLLIFTAKLHQKSSRNKPKTSLQTSHLLKHLAQKSWFSKLDLFQCGNRNDTRLERFQLEESQDDSCWCKPSLRLQEENSMKKEETDVFCERVGVGRKLSHGKTLMTFHYTGWLIGILITVYVETSEIREFPISSPNMQKATEDLSEQTSFDPLSLCLDS